MKGFLKLIIALFSLIIVIMAAITLLITSEIITVGHVTKIMNILIQSSTISMITYIVSVVIGLLAIVAIILSDSLSAKLKGGIMLPSDMGAVQISNQTFENIIIGITKKYSGIKTVKVEVKVKNNGITTNIYAYVLQDTVIADLTASIQEDIKQTILKQTTVLVESVDIRVKGTYALSETK